MKRFKLYTHMAWKKYAWESLNDARTMAWEVRRCYYGDPHPAPGPDETVFYTDSELEHALGHNCAYKVALMLESRFITPGFYSYLEHHINAFDWVLTYDDELLTKFPEKCIYFPHGNCLVRRKNFAVYPKSRLISFISSIKNLNVPGHVLRHTIYNFYIDDTCYWKLALPQNFELDLYGGIADKPIDDKLDSLKDYHFQIVVENGIIDSYFTEKILDCFVTGTIPIYYGTRKVDELFDAGGIIHFSTMEELLGILRELTPQSYLDRLAAVETNFELAQQYVVAEDWIFENTDVFHLGEVNNTDRSPLLRSPPTNVTCPPTSDTLQTLNGGGGRYIGFHTEVDESKILRKPISTRLQAPRTTDAQAPTGWYPQLTTAYLLQVPGGIIGDNVVFERDAYYGFSHWWLGSGTPLYANAREVRQVDEAISLSAWGGEAFQHFIMDVTPRLGLVLELLESPAMARVKIVSHLEGARFAQWFWQEMGLLDRIFQKPLNAREGMVIQTAVAYYPGWAPDEVRRHELPRNTLGIHPRDALLPVQQRLGVLDDTPQDLAVYLRRTGVRSVGNEEALLSALKDLLAGSGLQLHIFESSGDYDRDRDILKRARVVLGPHGGAFANLIFAQPGTRVIEFVPALESYANQKEQDRNYWGLAQAAGQEYWAVSPENFSFDHAGMEVSVGDVCGLIEELIS